MILSDIRRYLQQCGQATLADIALHFDADPDAMRGMLGDPFVDLYTALKDAEYQEFQEIITPWEREILMFNV